MLRRICSESSGCGKSRSTAQSRFVPTRGATISFEMVMSAQTEVDHILPFSRTLDNSMSNLVVCLADANRDKGNSNTIRSL